jgi:hypothetical protein
MIKIENFISDVFRIFENLGKNEYYIKKTIKGCKTYEQCLNCSNLISSVKNLTKNRMDKVLKGHRFISIVTFGRIRKSLEKKLNERIKQIKYYHIFILAKLKENENRRIKK